MVAKRASSRSRSVSCLPSRSGQAIKLAIEGLAPSVSIGKTPVVYIATSPIAPWRSLYVKGGIRAELSLRGSSRAFAESAQNRRERLSRAKRASRSASDANASGGTLMATSRSRLVSIGHSHLTHAAGAVLGFINGLRFVWTREPAAETYRVMAIGAAESLVPMFVAFASLTVAWLLVAVGMGRQGTRL